MLHFDTDWSDDVLPALSRFGLDVHSADITSTYVDVFRRLPSMSRWLPIQMYSRIA